MTALFDKLVVWQTVVLKAKLLQGEPQLLCLFCLAGYPLFVCALVHGLI